MTPPPSPGLLASVKVYILLYSIVLVTHNSRFVRNFFIYFWYTEKSAWIDTKIPWRFNEGFFLCSLEAIGFPDKTVASMEAVIRRVNYRPMILVHRWKSAVLKPRNGCQENQKGSANHSNSFRLQRQGIKIFAGELTCGGAIISGMTSVGIVWLVWWKRVQMYAAFLKKIAQS